METDRQAALNHAPGDPRVRDDDGNFPRLRTAHPLWGTAIPTGSLSLDLAIGVGGIPRGRITEIFGPESSGKTTLAQHVVAEAQRMGGTAAYIDMEHALDPHYARACGVDVDNLLIAQPDTGEQALEITETLVRSAAVDVLVVDSVAALVPRAEIEGQMGETHLGLIARLMSQTLRTLSDAIRQTHTAVVFTNQLRHKISMDGSPETTTGGVALKLYAAVRLDMRCLRPLRAGRETIGSRTRVRVVKNKVAAPFKQAEFDILYAGGISKTGDILDLATTLNLVEKRGSSYMVGELRLPQGREQAIQFLQDNPAITAEIEATIRQKFLPPPVVPLD
jgi:recombination protein RecA